MISDRDQSTIELDRRQISIFSNEYKQRRRLQMLRFFGATIFTLVSARLAFRGVASRKYVPSMFELNYKRPPYSYQGEAISALAYGSGLSIGGFSMTIFGACWIMDVSTFPEVSIKLKEMMGESSERNKVTNMELDEDTKKVTEALESLFNRRE